SVFGRRCQTSRAEFRHYRPILQLKSVPTSSDPFPVMKNYRILIYSTVAPDQLHQLLRRILIDLPGVEIAGIVHPPKSMERPSGIAKVTIISPIVGRLKEACSTAFHRVLRWFHAVKNVDYPTMTSLEELKNFCSAHNISTLSPDELVVEGPEDKF